MRRVSVEQEMAQYRWNNDEVAAAYDEAAGHVHPYYVEVQDMILSSLPMATDAKSLLVDLGGGSGRLVERFLSRFPRATAVVVDQSAAFLGLAHKRLEKFADRVHLHLCRLQDDWVTDLPQSPSAVVSMSAIHHLDAEEKTRLYGVCHDTLTGGGVLLNGDEVRRADDMTYLSQLKSGAQHMDRIVDDGLVSPAMAKTLLGWQQRNIACFGEPRRSGDDCHETIDAQIEYLTRVGFGDVSVPWQKDMWAVLYAAKNGPV